MREKPYQPPTHGLYWAKRQGSTSWEWVEVRPDGALLFSDGEPCAPDKIAEWGFAVRDGPYGPTSGAPG